MEDDKSSGFFPSFSSCSSSTSSSSSSSSSSVRLRSNARPGRHRPWRRVASLLAASSVAPFVLAYDYKDIIPKYCHPEKDWGPIPERPEDVTELKQVQVFIRHGARVPVHGGYCWDDDKEGQWDCELNYLFDSVKKAAPLAGPFREEFLAGRNRLQGNCFEGQLVSEGFDMEFNNGRRLQEAYIEREGFLPPTLDGLSLETLPSVLNFRSTAIPRTKQSGMALLSGLYPSSTYGSLPYIPLHTMDFSKDNMEPRKSFCPVVESANYDYLLAWPRKDELMRHCASLDTGNSYDGDKGGDVNNCFVFLKHVLDCLMSRMCPTVPFTPHNATIPEYFFAEDWRGFREFWDLIDQTQWHYFQAMVQAGGMSSFTEEVLEHALLAATGRPGTSKLVFWSGHDTGPMEPMYAAFGLRTEPPFWPSFASMLVLELWGKDDGSTVARWISNNQVEQTMPWKTFYKKAASIVSLKEKCGHDADASEIEDSERWSTSFLMAIVFVATALGTLFGRCSVSMRMLDFKADSRRGVAAAQLGRASPLE